MDVFDQDLRRLLVDDATLLTGLDGRDLVKSFRTIISACVSGESDSFKDSLFSRLFATHRREPFLLDDEVAIPHFPCDVKTPAVGWFRSSSGLADASRPGAKLRIVFFAVAPDRLLKHMMAVACPVLKDVQFRHEFKQATTGRDFRLAVATGFERQMARTITPAEILQERARAILDQHRRPRANSRDVHIDYLLVSNRRGLHARFSARIVQCVSKYDCDEVIFSRSGNSVSGSSIMGLMMLAADTGYVVEVVIAGRQAKELGARLAELFAQEIVIDNA